MALRFLSAKVSLSTLEMLAPPEQTEKHRLRQRYEVECGEE